MANKINIEQLLADAGITINSFSATKKKSFYTSEGRMSAEELARHLKTVLKPKIKKREYDDETIISLMDDEVVEAQLSKHGKSFAKEISDVDLTDCVLNFNMAAKGKEEQFFVTKDDVALETISGKAYLTLHGLNPSEASIAARKIFPEYTPRAPKGVSSGIRDGKKINIFNTYIPPKWHGQEIKPLSRPPTLFTKLIEHLFPIKLEREFFFDWLHQSVFDRAPTYLVLCGDPGIGKNRLKIVMRALHGFSNTVDGKESTVTERFNSQLDKNTLVWFDELRYGEREENKLKEVQNDTISIERKGIDATRATRIWASFVISNNKPRDNHLAFDARKFVPLQLTKRRLEKSMTPEDIDLLTRKVEKETSPDFDLKFVCDVIGWLRKRGVTGKWNNLEYRGPMFWTLAHTSMTQWQKKCIELMLTEDIKRASYDSEKDCYLWSKIYERYLKRHRDPGLKFADMSSIEVFFNKFKDVDGQSVFKTERVKGAQNITGDFYIKLITPEIKVFKEQETKEEENEKNIKENRISRSENKEQRKATTMERKASKKDRSRSYRANPDYSDL